MLLKRQFIPLCRIILLLVLQSSIIILIESFSSCNHKTNHNDCCRIMKLQNNKALLFFGITNNKWMLLNDRSSSSSTSHNTMMRFISQQQSQQKNQYSSNNNRNNNNMELFMSSITHLDDATSITETSSTTTIKDAADTTSTSSSTIPLYQLAIAGCITTFVADMCMHPMDSIKTIMQSDIGNNGDLSLIQAGQYILDHGGIGAFYSGFLTYGIADGIGGSIKFTIWELWKQNVISKFDNNNNNNMNDNQIHDVTMSTSTTIKLESSSINKQIDNNDLLYINIIKSLLLWIGAAISFIISSIVIVPGELVKQQLQMSHYDNVIHAITTIMNDSGILGFFIGYDGVFYRDVPYTMIELGLYEILKNIIQNYKINNQHNQQQEQQHTFDSIESESDSIRSSTIITTTTLWYEEIGAAAITGAIASFVTTPLDTIKTKLMVNQELYPNFTFIDCLYDTIHQHGYMSIFAGVTARMAWIIPFTILYLPTYDYIKRTLQQYHDHNVPNEKIEKDEMIIAASTAFTMSTGTTITTINHNYNLENVWDTAATTSETISPLIISSTMSNTIPL